jgi:hypothetical protein
VEGKLASLLKNYIDREFMRTFQTSGELDERSENVERWCDKNFGLFRIGFQLVNKRDNYRRLLVYSDDKKRRES